MIKLQRLASALLSKSIKGHFGQWGEDILVRKLFPKNKANGTYLDIGCYHPFIHSNTAYLWLKGWRGYNIDANAQTIKIFDKIRPQDDNIWSAIIPQTQYDAGLREVSLLTPKASDNASGISATGTVHQAVGMERQHGRSTTVPATSISELLADRKVGAVDYLNIDIEGYDEMILQEIDLAALKPTVVTIEDYSEDFAQLLSSSISRRMANQGYSLAGRAGPTTVFLKKSG